MKLIANQSVKPEPIHQVKLVQREDGVTIEVGGYYILNLLDNGKIRRVGCVPERLGFLLDTLGKVQIAS
jgi:hypothetical protein